jgi:hypothetical protein
VAKGFKIKEKLDEKDERIFPLLRWILCSFRGHLRYIDAANSQEVGVSTCLNPKPCQPKPKIDIHIYLHTYIHAYIYIYIYIGHPGAARTGLQAVRDDVLYACT